MADWEWAIDRLPYIANELVEIMATRAMVTARDTGAYSGVKASVTFADTSAGESFTVTLSVQSSKSVDDDASAEWWEEPAGG